MTYTLKNGLTITSRLKPCGVFYAMGETHIEEEMLFDVFQNGELLATMETWEEAKNFCFGQINQKTTNPNQQRKNT
jgi:hypothetical protein